MKLRRNLKKTQNIQVNNKTLKKYGNQVKMGEKNNIETPINMYKEIEKMKKEGYNLAYI